MCAPLATLAVAGLQTVSGLYSASAQNQQAQSQARYYEAVAEQKKQEGEIAIKRGETQSNLVQDSAKAEGKRQAMNAAEISASQKAALAANGVNLDSGSAQDIVSNTANKSRMDEIAIRYNADVKSWSATEDAKFQKWDSLNQANQNLFAAKNARAAGKQSAFNTLLGTATTVGSGFLK